MSLPPSSPNAAPPHHNKHAHTHTYTHRPLLSRLHQSVKPPSECALEAAAAHSHLLNPTAPSLPPLLPQAFTVEAASERETSECTLEAAAAAHRNRRQAEHEAGQPAREARREEGVLAKQRWQEKQMQQMQGERRPAAKAAATSVLGARGGGDANVKERASSPPAASASAGGVAPADHDAAGGSAAPRSPRRTAAEATLSPVVEGSPRRAAAGKAAAGKVAEVEAGLVEGGSQEAPQRPPSPRSPRQTGSPSAASPPRQLTGDAANGGLGAAPLAKGDVAVAAACSSGGGPDGSSSLHQRRRPWLSYAGQQAQGEEGVTAAAAAASAWHVEAGVRVGGDGSCPAAGCKLEVVDLEEEEWWVQGHGEEGGHSMPCLVCCPCTVFWGGH